MSNSSSFHQCQVQCLIYTRSSINHHWIKIMSSGKFPVNSHANFKWWIKLPLKLQVHWFQSKNKARRGKGERGFYPRHYRFMKSSALILNIPILTGKISLLVYHLNSFFFTFLNLTEICDKVTSIELGNQDTHTHF